MADYDFMVKTNIFHLSFNRKFNIFDGNDKLIGVCVQKAFKLKEDIRVYSDEGLTKEFIRIQAQNVIDFSATYNVYDSATNKLIGFWERKGLESILRDSWSLLDGFDGNEIAQMQEDNMKLALIRRYIPFGNLIPQTYYLKNKQGVVLASFIQDFNPFLYALKVKIYKKPNAPDPKMAMAGAMLLAVIEGRQNQQ
ncbi:MAG: hypothetical protein J6Z11_13365 [Candidatus Riflebacteria bacterium]|nr:hypothetical protein [Candidatus Riflebacteria bacterium]